MKFEAVLFDCDGVLVDSEPITNGVLREMLIERGWTDLTQEQCLALFIGKTVREERALIEERTGQPFTEEWLQAFYVRRNAELEKRLAPVPHIHETVEFLHRRLDTRIACASGADRRKVELQLVKVGLHEYFAGRIFSGHEFPRSKPHPDVYLAAASAVQREPARCAVVEDTVTGVQAGVAAGATVFGFAMQGNGDALRAAGAAVVFDDMRALPRLLA